MKVGYTVLTFLSRNSSNDFIVMTITGLARGQDSRQGGYQVCLASYCSFGSTEMYEIWNRNGSIVRAMSQMRRAGDFVWAEICFYFVMVSFRPKPLQEQEKLAPHLLRPISVFTPYAWNEGTECGLARSTEQHASNCDLFEHPHWK